MCRNPIVSIHDLNHYYDQQRRFYSRDILDVEDKWVNYIDDLGDPGCYEDDELPLEEREGYAYLFITRDGWHVRHTIYCEDRDYLPMEIQLNDEKVERWQTENSDKRGIVSQDCLREHFWSATTSTITHPVDESLVQSIRPAHTGTISDNVNDELPRVTEV